MADNDTRSPRFMHWVAFLVFSTITLGSVVEVVKDNRNDTQISYSKSSERWSIACSAITFIITFIVVVMHSTAVSSLLIVGTKLEGVLVLILFGFWIASVCIITDARYGLAVNLDGGVKNGNLYYFSWAGFVTSVTLVVSYLRHVFGVDVAGEIQTRSARLTGWSAHLACSLVVMGTSANFYDNSCGGNSKSKCSRAVYGIVLGAIGTLFAVTVVSMKVATSKAPFLAEVGLSLILILLYCIGVALITSEEGPGATLGNLYYFSWLGFMSSLWLIASCYEDFISAKTASAQEQQGSTSEP